MVSFTKLYCEIKTMNPNRDIHLVKYCDESVERLDSRKSKLIREAKNKVLLAKEPETLKLPDGVLFDSIKRVLVVWDPDESESKLILVEDLGHC